MMAEDKEPRERISEHPPSDSDIIQHAHLYLREPFASVIQAGFRERVRQVAEKGYNAAHDAQHTPEEWAQMFGQHYREALRLAKTGNVELFKAEVVQGYALYMACLEALNMDLAGQHTTKEAANRPPRRPT